MDSEKVEETPAPENPVGEQAAEGAAEQNGAAADQEQDAGGE